MVNKLIDECNETIDEVKLTPSENENIYKCSFLIINFLIIIINCVHCTFLNVLYN